MHTPILILPIKVELRKIDLEYIKNKAVCLENKTHFKKALSHLHFTLPYHLYASSRLFPTTFQDMWLSMLEPKLIISIFKYKSTDLLYYYKHNSQEKVPKTESKVGHPPPPLPSPKSSLLQRDQAGWFQNKSKWYNQTKADLKGEQTPQATQSLLLCRQHTC